VAGRAANTARQAASIFLRLVVFPRGAPRRREFHRKNSSFPRAEEAEGNYFWAIFAIQGQS